MTLAQAISAAITISMFLIVLALGLEARLSDALSLFRRPSLLLRSILAMNIIMLGVALAIAVIFDPPPAIKIALVALSLSPVPPILPGKQERAGGSQSYSIGLLIAAAIVAVVLVPLAVSLVGKSFGIAMREPADRVAGIVLLSIILPLAAGIFLRQWAPGLAKWAEHRLARAAWVLLLLASLPVLVLQWPQVWALIGSGLLIGLAAFTLIGLVVGHALGGPLDADRTVLALAASARHPGVAMSIAAVNFPHEKGVLAVVLVHLLVATVLTMPYVRYRTRHQAEALGGG